MEWARKTVLFWMFTFKFSLYDANNDDDDDDIYTKQIAHGFI